MKYSNDTLLFTDIQSLAQPSLYSPYYSSLFWSVFGPTDRYADRYRDQK